MPSFQFALQPARPSVGDVVSLYIQDDLGHVNSRTSWFLVGTESLFEDVRIGAFEDGLMISMRAVAAGTARLRLVGDYQYDFVCYPGSAVGTVQSDPFTVTVTEAPATAQGTLALAVAQFCAATECEVFDLEPSPHGAVVFFELVEDRIVQNVAIDGYPTSADAAQAFGPLGAQTIDVHGGLLRVVDATPDYCAPQGCRDQVWTWLYGCWILRGFSHDSTRLRLAPQPVAIVEDFLQIPDALILFRLCPAE